MRRSDSESKDKTHRQQHSLGTVPAIEIVGEQIVIHASRFVSLEHDVPVSVSMSLSEEESRSQTHLNLGRVELGRHGEWCF